MADQGRGGSQSGDRPIRLAIALYGLMRHNCSTANFRNVFFAPLARSPQRYSIDVFLRVNIADSDTTKTVPGRHRSYYDRSNPDHPDRFAWSHFNPVCVFAAEDQDVVDEDLEQPFANTVRQARPSIPPRPAELFLCWQKNTITLAQPARQHIVPKLPSSRLRLQYSRSASMEMRGRTSLVRCR